MAARYTHAGGVVFRQGRGGPEYLIVEARRSRGVWVLPKGHVEDDETLEETAIREVQEEGGSKAEVIEALGRVAFGDVSVAFFLMRHRRAVRAAEDRRVEWCDYARACRRLAFDDIQRLLRRAHARVAREGNGAATKPLSQQKPKNRKRTSRRPA